MTCVCCRGQRRWLAACGLGSQFRYVCIYVVAMLVLIHGVESCVQVSVPEATLLASAAVATLVSGAPALADNPSPPPEIQQATKSAQNQSITFPSAEAPAPATTSSSGLPEGNQWRYSEFISAVEKGKVERVRFSKDGSQLQLTAVDGRRAQVWPSTQFRCPCVHECPMNTTSVYMLRIACRTAPYRPFRHRILESPGAHMTEHIEL